MNELIGVLRHIVKKMQHREASRLCMKALRDRRRLTHIPKPRLGRQNGKFCSENAGRIRARKLYPLGPCERCGESPENKSIERHHIDGDTSHNEAWNIKLLCSRCHKIEHRRAKEKP